MNKTSSPLRSIRIYCRQCSGDSPKEVRLCVIPDCPLYPYRQGHNNKRKGIGGHSGSSIQKSHVELGRITKEEVSRG